MEAVQQRTTEIGKGRGRLSTAGAGLLLAGVVVVSMTAVGWVSRPASGTRAGVPADPLLAPAVIGFRANERASLGVPADPLLAPAVIGFRANERASLGR